MDTAINSLMRMAEMMGGFTFENDITQEYVDYIKAMPREYYAAMSFDYGTDLSYSLYTDYSTEAGEKRMSVFAADSMLRALLNKAGYAELSSSLSDAGSLFSQAPDNTDFILSQYDIVNEGGHIPEEAGEIMIVVNDDTEISDILLAQLGYSTQEEFLNAVYKSAEDERYDESLDKTRFSYDELLGKTFTFYPNDEIYSATESMLGTRFTYDPSREGEGIELTITAILRPKEGLSFGSLDTGIYYTQQLADEIVSANKTSQIAQYMRDNAQEGGEYALAGTSVGGVIMGAIPTFELEYSFEGQSYTQTMCVGEMYTVQDTTVYALLLRDVGGNPLPQTISIYPVDFELKDGVTAYLNRWNEEGDITVNGTVLSAQDRTQITYTDNLSVIIAMIGDMIDIVTYALVAFTALSLVVSTVMIAIITYVSVIERVKEIGVIRSLGGRKKDVSRLFNAETFIIGFISGVIGIVITYLICLLINGVVSAAIGITGIASLPFTTALILIAVSIVLTLISGLIPARLAAKKDPVEALRSE